MHCIPLYMSFSYGKLFSQGEKNKDLCFVFNHYLSYVYIKYISQYFIKWLLQHLLLLTLLSLMSHPYG